MASELWLREDIKNVLLALELSNAHLAEHLPQAEVAAYRQGFRAALAAAAVSFGISGRDLSLLRNSDAPLLDAKNRYEPTSR